MNLAKQNIMDEYKTNHKMVSGIVSHARNSQPWTIGNHTIQYFTKKSYNYFNSNIMISWTLSS